MALPIKATPHLKGKEAREFVKKMKEVDAGKHIVSQKEYLRAKKTYDKCVKAWGRDPLDI